MASPGPGRECVMVWNSTKPLDVQVWESDDWDDLLEAVKEYRLDTYAQVIVSASLLFLSPIGHDEPVLEFTYPEWQAFVAGVRAGEFDYDKLCSPALRGPVAGRLAATGAVECANAPAPVAAAVDPAQPPVGRGPLFAERSSVVAGAGSDDPGLVPAAARPNVVAFEDVPAGRDPECVPAPVGRLDAVATTGQPGSVLSDLLDEILQRLGSVERLSMLVYRDVAGIEPITGLEPVPVGDVDELLRRGARPLVEFDLPDTSRAREDMGWAPPTGVNEAGEVGPAHPRSGPTEPAAAVRS